ncbi:hypothetical protein EVAR_91986_1 [Eumeta japonica]|uniref:Uncharacterized protein n=1 Tax=Eumeta variegata TaxID=151549 RepID=A0A4C2AA78_EUMVA|nr:hypothetical protein EVAR_91986_1 [Eumeta japonica]
MTSVVFGVASSPCTAIYIKNKNAEEHRKEHARAADAIVYNHYMDDYLQSFPTVEEATRAKEVALVHNKAKFELGKWASNEPAVLEAVSSTSSQDAEIKLDPEKILGLIWRPARDVLSYNLDMKRVSRDIADGERRPTKREALGPSCPFMILGLITPITVGAKRILQATWKTGWVGTKSSRTSCTSNGRTGWLHTFVDASETAYAAAVYWRMRTDDGKVHVSRCSQRKSGAAKGDVDTAAGAQAAVLGSRLAKP